MRGCTSPDEQCRADRATAATERETCSQGPAGHAPASPLQMRGQHGKVTQEARVNTSGKKTKVSVLFPGLRSCAVGDNVNQSGWRNDGNTQNPLLFLFLLLGAAEGGHIPAYQTLRLI